MDLKCPGGEKKTIPELYLCPKCGAEIEIWSDEKKRRCKACNEVVMKEQAKKK